MQKIQTLYLMSALFLVPLVNVHGEVASHTEEPITDTHLLTNDSETKEKEEDSSTPEKKGVFTSLGDFIKRKKKTLFVVFTLLGFLFVAKRGLENWIIFPAVYSVHDPAQEDLRSFQDRHGRRLCYLSRQTPIKELSNKEEKEKQKKANAQKKIYVYFPGNAEVMTQKKTVTLSSGMPMMRDDTLTDLGKTFDVDPDNLFVSIYPGCASSQRSCTGAIFDGDKTLYAASDDFMKELLAQGYKPENITLLGFSLGGASVFYLAAHYACRQAVTIAAFSSIRNVVRSLLGPFGPVVAPFMHYHLNNLAYARKLKSPWIGLHAKNDGLIPPSHLEKLYQALPSEIKKHKRTAHYLIRGNQLSHNSIEMMVEAGIRLQDANASDSN